MTFERLTDPEKHTSYPAHRQRCGLRVLAEWTILLAPEVAAEVGGIDVQQ